MNQIHRDANATAQTLVGIIDYTAKELKLLRDRVVPEAQPSIDLVAGTYSREVETARSNGADFDSAALDRLTAAAEKAVAACSNVGVVIVI